MKANGSKPTQAARKQAALTDVKNTIWNWMASPNALKKLSVEEVHVLIATVQQIGGQLIDNAYAAGMADKEAEMGEAKVAQPEQPATEQEAT